MCCILFHHFGLKILGHPQLGRTAAAAVAISALLPEEARQHKVPTEAELALTYPPGYKGDAAAEAERRPGTDTVDTRRKGRGR